MSRRPSKAKFYACFPLRLIFVYENAFFRMRGRTAAAPGDQRAEASDKLVLFRSSSALQSALTDCRRIKATTAITDRSPISAFVDALRALTAGAKLVAAIAKTYSVSLGAGSNCPDRGLREGGRRSDKDIDR